MVKRVLNIYVIAALLFTVLTNISAISEEDAQINSLKQWQVGSIVSEKAVEKYGKTNCFASEPISDNVFNRMQGKSYKAGGTIKRIDLIYLKVLHRDHEGRIKLGEMVVNRAIAEDVLYIFLRLFEEKYPIERMQLIDDFNANDEQSMMANNTSAFCYRTISGSKTLSAHSKGMAIDINPLYNPYCKVMRNGTKKILPKNAKKYTDRTKNFKYKIEKGDICYKLFTEKGFIWGGSWRNSKDYQHFERKN